MHSDVNSPRIHPPNVPSTPMSFRKRALQHDYDPDVEVSTSGRRESGPSLPPTPSSTASPKLKTSKLKTPKQPRTASSQSITKPSKQSLAADQQTDPDCDLEPSRKRRRHSSTKPGSKRPLKSSPEPDSKPLGQSSEPDSTWFVEDWLKTSIQEKSEDSVETLPTIEIPSSPQILAPESLAASDQMSQQDGENSLLGSAASSRSERLNASSPLYRGTLKMNGVVLDNFGRNIPPEVQELVDKHIWKERRSPPLGATEKNSVVDRLEEIWDNAEPTVSSILETDLFPLRAPGIQEGGDTLWSTKPLPRNSDYPYALPAPKTDRHLGFSPSLKSTWTTKELGAADHTSIRPYSQPTRENLFPSFLLDLKSEASRGTLYAAEGQLATAGAHRVNSLMWLLDRADPSRTRSNTDALVFSAAVNQREAIAHVHFYNPEDGRFYMSFIRSFSFAMDIQGCRNYSKNVIDWLLEIQQPIIRELLSKLHPLTKSWKKGRAAGPIAERDVTESITSEDGRPTKSQRTLED